MKVIICFLILGFTTVTFAQKKKVNYTYKKFERFDFDALDVEGGVGSPGDLSISPRFRKEFKNKIPERKNFNKEIIQSIDGIR